MLRFPYRAPRPNDKEETALPTLTANGLKATNIKGHPRVYLVESAYHVAMLELRPGVSIEDVDTANFYRYEDPRNTHETLFEATKYTLADYDNDDLADPGWHVLARKRNTYTVATKKDAIRHLRMELAEVTNWMWDDVPAQEKPATPSKPKPVKGTKVTYCDFSTSSTDYRREVHVTFTPRNPIPGSDFQQGYNVSRADNGRHLGWVCPPEGKHKYWTARTAEGAFRGDDVDDLGYILDEVPENLTQNTPGWSQIEAVTRYDAVCGLVQHLCRQRATALGFGRNYDVRRWKEHDPEYRAYAVGGYQGTYPYKASR